MSPAVMGREVCHTATRKVEAAAAGYALSEHGLGRKDRSSRLSVTMYSTPWCGYCRTLKSAMDREGIPYTEIDIEQDLAAAEFVMRVNDGNQTVPTLRFADGSALTNPSLAQVKRRLARI